jgi:hypothetical protein
VRGLGVDDDVELGHGAPVAHVVAAAHEDNFLDTLHDARLLAGGHGDVGEARGGDQGDRARLVRHDGFNDEVDGVARVQLDGGLGCSGPSMPESPWMLGAVSMVRTRGRSQPAAKGTPVMPAIVATERAFRVTFSRVWLPTTVVTASSSMSGLP